MTRILLADQDDLATFGRDRGTGTTLPTTDLRRGDPYRHTGLAALMVYTGSNWRQAADAHVATEADAATMVTNHAAALHDGFRVYSTATEAQGVYDGTRFLWYDTAWQTYTPAIATTAVANLWTQGNASATGRYFRTGRQVQVEGHIHLGSTTTYGAGAAGAIFIRPPAGYYPATWTNPAGQSMPLPSNVYLNNGAATFGWVVIAGSTTATNRWFTFYQQAGVALTGAAGSSGSWNMWSSGQFILWNCTYDTNFEA